MKKTIYILFILLFSTYLFSQDKVDEITVDPVIPDKEEITDVSILPIKIDTTVNSKTNTFIVKGKVFTDFSSTKTLSWRFVYNKEQLVIPPFYSASQTFTPYKVVECKTLADAINEIIRLELKITEEQEEYIDNIKKDIK